MLPKARLLDPRERSLARQRPVADAANIPFEELALRMHELPPPADLILVAAEPPLAEATIRYLTERGRHACASPFTYGGAGNPARLWSPNPRLEAFVPTTPASRAIDLGCGTARDAIFLASAGWRVTAVDRLPEALARGQVSAQALLDAPEAIDWHAGELEDFTVERAAYDLALIFFVLSPAAIRAAAESLSPGGILLLESFSEARWLARGRLRKPARPGEPEFEILRADENEKSIAIKARRR